MGSPETAVEAGMSPVGSWGCAGVWLSGAGFASQMDLYIEDKISIGAEHFYVISSSALFLPLATANVQKPKEVAHSIRSISGGNCC